MAGALLLASQRAVPARLTEEGFQFESAELAGAFARTLQSGV
jgi:NAD dependent epimerase/dehydratase family enzyme